MERHGKTMEILGNTMKHYMEFDGNPKYSSLPRIQKKPKKQPPDFDVDFTEQWIVRSALDRRTVQESSVMS